MTLERYAGYWALVVFSLEVLLLFGLLWKTTGIAFFKRWLWRFSWLLPMALCLAYLTRSISLDPRAVHTLWDCQLLMTRLFVHDSEILAAHSIPLLAVAILILMLARHPKLPRSDIVTRATVPEQLRRM